MEVSGNMLCVYFARLMFMTPDDGLNHQASYGFILNKNNLSRISNIRMPSAGHSFNQFILPIENGFVFADQGDVGPRGFYFNTVQNGIKNKNITSFAFKQGNRYQATFAQLGGLAKTTDGYLFAGTYEKNKVVSAEHNDSRNVFILTLDNELNNISEPIWITSYTNKDNDNAASPKIADLYNGRYLLMWERMGRIGYESTYMTIIDKTGRQLITAKEIPDVRLNANDILRYNRTNGNVYWAVDNHDKNIDVYSFNPDNPINAAMRTGAPVGGYGLSLTDFTVDKVSVNQTERFTVKVKAQNMGSEAFPGGNFGAALVDNSNNIVEVVGIWNYTWVLNPRANSSASPWDINCAVPNTVSPGRYRLRIVIRPTGGEWRVATMSVDNCPNSIDFTVQ
jgi:hypothetical protein